MAYPNNLPEGNIKQYDDAFQWWKQAIINEDELEGFGHEEFYVPIGVYFPSGNFTRAAFYTWIRNYWSKPPSGELYTYQLPVLTGQDKWDKKTLNDWGRAKLFELNIFGNVTNGGSTSSTPAITMSGRYGINNWTRSSLLFMRFGFKQFLEYGGLVFHDTPKYMQSDSIYMPPTVIIEVDTEEPDPVIGITDVTHNSARIEILNHNWFNQQDVTGHTVSWKSTNQTTWSTIPNTLNLTGLSGSTGYQAYITLEGERSIIDSSNIVSFATDATPYITLSRSSITVNADVTSFTFNIESNLSWTITDNRDWISVNTSSGSGDRNGIVVSFPQNTGGQRSGTITVKGGGITRTITVTQRAVQIYPVNLKSATSEIGPYQGATSPDAAMNNVYSHNMYSTVSSHLNYQPGTRFFINSSASQPMNASGWFRIADTTYAVQIDTIGYFIALVNTAESVALSPTSRTVSHSTNSTSFSITSNTSWTISANASWVTLNKSSGTGNTTVTASFGNNTGSSDRTATITLESASGYRQATATLRQSKEVQFTISPTQYNFPHNLGGSFNIEVRATGSWTANGVGDVLNLLPSSGNGNGNIGVFVGGNNTQFPKISSVEVISGGVSRVCNIMVPGTGGGPGGLNTPYNFTSPETLEGMTIEGELKDNDNE